MKKAVICQIRILSNTYIEMLIIHRFCTLANEIWYPRRVTIPLPKFQIYLVSYKTEYNVYSN